jgi:UDP-3-O-[3-hydroxymyristoyl] glucosamine N-acyltransferase
MEHNWFFPPHNGIRLIDLADAIGAKLENADAADQFARSVAPVYRAKEGDICYMLSRKHRAELDSCKATAIICDKTIAALVPPTIPVLLTPQPHAAFAMAGNMLHPAALRPAPALLETGISDKAVIDPSARIEPGVEVEPFAVIGAGAEIGEGTRIGSGAVIGAGVRIGRYCTVAAGASVLCALVGNNVIIHPGARIGQDGFGFAPGPRGMIKIVQIGRVIIQDDVEVGAGTTIDRGAMDDTVIGEGTKLDNQIQIGHNVRIGRHCGIASQVGIAGSTKIGDGVLIGGASAINGHITIGSGVQIAAMSGVAADIPPGERYGGIPARPMRDFLRDIAEMTARSHKRQKTTGGKDE